MNMSLVLAVPFETTAPSWQLLTAALVGIALIVVLISALKAHPFLALMLGAFVMALLAGVSLTDSFSSFTKGLGQTVGDVGVLIVLGYMIARLLIDSGGADAIVDTIVGKAKPRHLPWALALIAFIVGIPMFFEVGLVLLIPVVILIARRTRQPVIALGIPALAGLSVLHGFVPPHPGPLVAISALHANIGLTLALGLLIALPTVVVAGPLLQKILVKRVPKLASGDMVGGGGTSDIAPADRPPFLLALSVILLPVVLMLLRTVAELVLPSGGWVSTAFGFVGTPVVALLIAVLYGIGVLGFRNGRGRAQVSTIIEGAFPPIASVLLIVGAGGGFKQTLTDSGIADVLGRDLSALPISPLLAAWLVAVFIRLATGSATVATITASGVVVPLAGSLSPTHLALLVLVIGAGSLFFSHVNDAGFWLVKGYFGLTVGETFLTWSLMETVISVMGLLGGLGLSLVI